MSDIKRVIAVIAGAAVLVALLLAGAGAIVIWGVGKPYAGLFESATPLPSLPFDSAGWRAASSNDESEDSVRLLMASSFMETQQPLGKTREQIIDLLGEPDDTAYFKSYDMVYHLGPERGPFGIDCEWLVIRLTDGVVTEAHIASD